LNRFSRSKLLSNTLMPQMLWHTVSWASGRLIRGTHFVDLNHNEQIVIREVHFVPVADCRCDLFDDTTASERVVIPDSRANGELAGSQHASGMRSKAAKLYLSSFGWLLMEVWLKHIDCNLFQAFACRPP
jgi:hypothetical protein